MTAVAVLATSKERGAIQGADPNAQTSYVRAYAIFQCLAALASAGLLDDLAAGHLLDPEAAARTRGLNAGALQAIARYLYGVRVLRRTATGAYVLEVDLSEHERGSIEMLRAYDAMFHGLPDILTNAATYGPALARDEELDARATARVCQCTAYSSVIEVAMHTGARHVLDLGCGAGELLIRLCATHHGVCGYGIDISKAAIRYARKRVREERLAHRVRLGVGDIFDLDAVKLRRVPWSKVDLILATSVFHEFAYGTVKRLISALAAVRRVFPGIPLILYEAIEQPDDVLRSVGSAALEHHLFHRLSLQGIAEESSWLPAFNRAGYRPVRSVDVPSGGRVFVLVDGAVREHDEVRK